MIALSLQAMRDYVPVCDRALPKEEQTTFVLRPLSPEDQALLDNVMGEIVDGAYQLKLGTQSLLAVHLGLHDVRNLKDEEGNEVKLVRSGPVRHGRYQEISDEFLSRIPKDVRDEISSEIRRSAVLGKEERKN